MGRTRPKVWVWDESDNRPRSRPPREARAVRDRPDTRSYTWSDSSWTCNNWHSLQSLAVQHCCFWQPDQRGKIVTRLGDSVIERQTCVNSDPDSDAICKIKVFISRNLHHTIDEIKINNIPEPKALLISIKYVFMATSAGVGFCIIFNFSVCGVISQSCQNSSDIFKRLCFRSRFINPLGSLWVPEHEIFEPEFSLDGKDFLFPRAPH